MRVPEVERFWFSLDAEWTVDHGGFLADPTAKYGNIFAPGALTLSQIRQSRTVFLIGEPGSGKSTIAKLASQADDTGSVALLDLKSYASEESLGRALRAHPAVRSWLDSGAELELFLDSLDECPIPSRNTVVPRILRELVEESSSRKWPAQRAGSQVERAEMVASAPQDPLDNVSEVEHERFFSRAHTGLWLRVLCRSGSYLPSSGSEFLAAVDGAEGEVSVFKLAPLRRCDAIDFVIANDGDAKQFFKQLERSGSSILAAIPLILQLLLRIFRQDGTLPSSAQEIYARGVVALCEEPNEQRGRANVKAVHHAAEELAFLCVGSGRSEVGIGKETETDEGRQVWYGEPVAYARRQGDGPSLDVLHAVTGTGLFSPARPRSMRWSHWSLAEFLAASFMKRKSLSLEQLRDIFIHPTTGHVFAQLEETAAWLASMHPNFLTWLVKNDPQCVLMTDVSMVDQEVRESIVKALLQGLEAKTLRDDHRNNYRHLNYPGLAATLRAWILDPRKDVSVRRVAIDIADQCELCELVPDMISLALDGHEEHYVRKKAAHFLARVGNEAARSCLRRLAFGEAGDDHDDDLRGIGLAACWPGSMAIDEVITCLKSEAKSHYFGAYAAFLNSRLQEHVKIGDIPALLKWVLDSWEHETMGWHIDRIRSFAILTGVSHIDEPGILEPLTLIVLRGLIEHRNVFEWDGHLPTKRGLETDSATRRKLVAEVVRRSVGDSMPADTWNLASLCHSEDFPWTLELAATCLTSSESRVWAELARCLVNWPEGANFDLVWEVAQQSELVARTYDHVLAPVPLDSETAEAGRKRIHREQERSSRRVPRRKNWVKRQLHNLIGKADANLDCFWQLSAALVNDDSGQYSPSNWVEPDVDKLPGWAYLSPEERTAWFVLCKRYILEREAKIGGWDANTVFHPDVAGYRAIRCVLESDESYILGQPKAFFDKWAPAVAMMAEQILGDDATLDNRILHLFVERSPGEMFGFIDQILDRECKSYDHPVLIEKLKHVWSLDLEEVFGTRLASGIPKTSYESNLLSKMLELGSDRARTMAEARIMDRNSADEDRRARAVGAAGALISSAGDGGWGNLYPILTNDEEFCAEVLLKAVHGSREPAVQDLVRRLGAHQSTELFRLICRVVPYRDDPDWEGGFVTQPQRLRILRDELVRHVASIGSEESYMALSKLGADDPPLLNMSWWLLEAEANLRRNAWVPHSLASLHKIIASSDGRIVCSDQQLFELVLRELKVIDETLRDEIRQLWNIPGSGEKRFSPHPKEENELSDYVKGRLEDRIRNRGVVLNREVKVRKGEQTDILIEAISNGPRGVVDTVSVTIETKCSWNDDLESAMKDQLLSRYLASSRRNFGILLVGWFDSVKWSDGGSKRRRNRDRSKFEPLLAGQAAELSDGDKAIAYFGLDCTLA